ncbi:MAG: hypothetical protein HKN20_16835, partial [Gemmatimonadetes bacterium]|nr:hypothetical protein [Gemmatimonadota bacterium]
MNRSSRILTIILLVAACIRIGYWFSYRDHPEFDTPMLDAGWFHEQALAAREGRWEGDESVFRAPGYVWWLAGMYGVVGNSPSSVRLIQLLLGVVTVFLVYRIGRTVYGERAGLFAAGLLALASPVFYFEGELLIASLLPLLTAALILSLLAARASASGRPAILAGIVAGAMAVSRPNVLLFLPAAFVWLYLRDRRRALLFAACAAVLIGGVTVRNHARSGEWILVSSQAGLNFYLGNNASADGRHAIFPAFPAWDNTDIARITAERIGRPATPREISNYWAAQAREEILADPGAAAFRMLKKVAYLFSARMIGNNRDLALTFSSHPVLRLPFVTFSLLVPLGLVGLLFARRRANDYASGPEPGRSEGRGLLISFTALYGLSIVLFFVCERFRVPLAVPLAVFAGAGMESLARRLPAWRRALPAWLLLAAALVLVRANLFQGEAQSMSGQEAFHRGNVHARRGETEEAIAAYREAIARIPTVAGPYYHLAAVLQGEGNAVESEELLRKAWSLAPDDPEIGNALAAHLRDTARADEALAVYRDVQTRAPGDPWAWLGAGSLLMERGAPEARTSLVRATETAPDLAAAWFERGNYEVSVGDLAGAKGSYEHVIALDPNAITPRMNYALVLY